MLCALDDDRWRVPALRDLDVQGLVGHLIGVEDDTQRCLEGDQEVALADHVASTQPAAEGQAGRTPAETRADWRQAANLTLERVREYGERGQFGDEVAMHGIRLPLGTLLVVRAFELWTHENDIRRATGLPASAPDESTLRLMTDLAARLLPVGGCRTGLTTPVRVRLVLAGPAGAPGMSPSDPVRPGRRTTPIRQCCASSSGRSTLPAGGQPSRPWRAGPARDRRPDRAADVLAATAALALD